MRQCTLTGFAVIGLIALLSHLGHAQDTRRVNAAITGALRWLAENQDGEGSTAGSWPAPRPEYRPAVASLAGLAFLANGYLPGEEPYGDVILGALDYVMQSMDPEGYLGQGDRSGMYIHAMGTLFGLSCLGMLGDDEKEVELAQWCRRALAVVVEAQTVRKSVTERGGWRYTPYTAESDLSVTCWQLLVLHAAAQCGYAIDSQVVDDALQFINNAYTDTEDESGGFLYRPGVSSRPEPGVTGAAVFIKAILEARPDERFGRSLKFLRETSPSWGGEQYGMYFFFASFYLTQGMFQVGGEAWHEYAADMRRILVEHQQGDGRWPFPPDNTPQSRLAGPAYPTAMGVLILSLEKQYLPMYQRQRAFY